MNSLLDFSLCLYKKANNPKIKILIELIANWKYIFIDRLNIVSEPIQINNNTLFISCESGCMIEILSNKEEIINSINKFFCDIVIEKLIVYPKVL